MLEVWKFPLEIDRVSSVRMPFASRILKVAEQGGKLCIWALVNPRSAEVVKSFRIAGTGHSITPEDGINFVETVMMSGGEVFHVFEVTK